MVFQISRFAAVNCGTQLKKSQFTNGHSNVSVANPKQSLLILSPERVIGEILYFVSATTTTNFHLESSQRWCCVAHNSENMCCVALCRHIFLCYKKLKRHVKSCVLFHFRYIQISDKNSEIGADPFRFCLSHASTSWNLMTY